MAAEESKGGVADADEARSRWEYLHTAAERTHIGSELVASNDSRPNIAHFYVRRPTAERERVQAPYAHIDAVLRPSDRACDGYLSVVLWTTTAIFLLLAGLSVMWTLRGSLVVSPTVPLLLLVPGPVVVVLERLEGESLRARSLANARRRGRLALLPPLFAAVILSGLDEPRAFAEVGAWVVVVPATLAGVLAAWALYERLWWRRPRTALVRRRFGRPLRRLLAGIRKRRVTRLSVLAARRDGDLDLPASGKDALRPVDIAQFVRIMLPRVARPAEQRRIVAFADGSQTLLGDVLHAIASARAEIPQVDGVSNVGELRLRRRLAPFNVESIVLVSEQSVQCVSVIVSVPKRRSENLVEFLQDGCDRLGQRDGIVARLDDVKDQPPGLATTGAANFVLSNGGDRLDVARTPDTTHRDLSSAGPCVSGSR